MLLEKALKIYSTSITGIKKFIPKSFRKKTPNKESKLYHAPIKIAQFFSDSYYRIGCPTELGHLIQTQMQSGKIGVYKFTEWQKNDGDWDVDWFIYTFDHYKAEGEQDYPIY